MRLVFHPVRRLNQRLLKIITALVRLAVRFLLSSTHRLVLNLNRDNYTGCDKIVTNFHINYK